MKNKKPCQWNLFMISRIRLPTTYGLWLSINRPCLLPKMYVFILVRTALLHLYWLYLYNVFTRHLNMECFDSVVPAIFLSYAPTFFGDRYPRHCVPFNVPFDGHNLHFMCIKLVPNQALSPHNRFVLESLERGRAINARTDIRFYWFSRIFQLSRNCHFKEVHEMKEVNPF